MITLNVLQNSFIRKTYHFITKSAIAKVPILMQFSYFHWIIDQNISVLRCSERIKPIKFSICTITWIKKQILQYYYGVALCQFVSCESFFFLIIFFLLGKHNNPTQCCNSVTKIFLFQIKYSLRVSKHKRTTIALKKSAWSLMTSLLDRESFLGCVAENVFSFALLLGASSINDVAV